MSIFKSPLLLGYLALAIVGRVLDPRREWWLAAVDLAVLLPVYVLAIRFWTRDDEPLAAPPPTTRRREAFVFGVVAFAIIAPSIWFALHPSTAPSSIARVNPDGWPTLHGVALNAVGSTVITLVPTIVLCAIVRMSPSQLGLRPRYLGLGIALIASSFVLALALRADHIPIFAIPAFALPIYVMHIFVNGFPEELLFRGLVMQRLLARLKSPVNAIVLSSIIFDAAHVPIALWSRGDQPAWEVIAHGFGGQPTGLVWAYLFYRTRSLWPGILWHTSFTILGIAFV